MSNIAERMNRKNLSQGRPIRTPEETARLRKQFARKQKAENIFAGILGGIAIALGAVFILALSLLPFALIIAAVWMVAFGITDLVMAGFNGWAVFWLVLGVFLLSRTRIRVKF